MINCSINFTIEDKTGALNEALDIFKKHTISLRRIESRPSKNFEWEYEFTVDVNVDCPEILNALQNDLAGKTKNVSVISISETLNKSSGMPILGWVPC
jgi:prephenate dehydratase